MKKIILFTVFIILCCNAFSSEFNYDENGFPVQRIEYTEEGKVTSNFVFKDNRLVFTTKFLNEEQEPFEIEYYLKSPIDKSLIGVKRFTGTNLVGDNYLYSEETLFLNVTDDLVFTTDFEVASDGQITLLEEDGTVNTYSSDGLLIKKESQTLSESFTYDDKRNLVLSYSSSTDFPSRLVKTEYKEEKKYIETVLENDLIDHVTVFEVSGKQVTMYENGIPIAVVYYYQDNKKVREVQYL